LIVSNVSTIFAACFFAIAAVLSSREVREVCPGLQLSRLRVVRTAKRIALGVVAVLGAIAYVWVAAVRAVPGVRRRKAEARARRLAA
jgi:hypothetical protein